MRKLTPILLLTLLLCNILGSTIVFFIDEWQEKYTAQEGIIFQEKGEHLVIKLPMSIPYQTSWSDAQETDNIIIYRGDFFRAYEHKFENDTLYTSLIKENASRENVLGLFQKIKYHLSDEPTNSNRKAINTLKNLSKDYTQINSRAIAWFWIEDLPSHIYTYQEMTSTSIISVHSPPPNEA